MMKRIPVYLLIRAALTAVIVTIFMLVVSDPTPVQIVLSIVVYFLIGLVINYVIDRLFRRY